MLSPKNSKQTLYSRAKHISFNTRGRQVYPLPLHLFNTVLGRSQLIRFKHTHKINKLLK